VKLATKYDKGVIHVPWPLDVSMARESTFFYYSLFRTPDHMDQLFLGYASVGPQTKWAKPVKTSMERWLVIEESPRNGTQPLWFPLISYAFIFVSDLTRLLLLLGMWSSFFNEISTQSYGPSATSPGLGCKPKLHGGECLVAGGSFLRNV